MHFTTWWIKSVLYNDYNNQVSEHIHHLTWSFLVAQLVKNPPAIQGTLVQFLSWEDPLEKGSATHSSILGLPWWFSWWRICLQCGRPGFNPWVGKIPWRRERLPIPIFLTEEFPGLYTPWGHKESDTTKQLSLSSHIVSNNFFGGGEWDA